MLVLESIMLAVLGPLNGCPRVSTATISLILLTMGTVAGLARRAGGYRITKITDRTQLTRVTTVTRATRVIRVTCNFLQ